MPSRDGWEIAMAPIPPTPRSSEQVILGFPNVKPKKPYELRVDDSSERKGFVVRVEQDARYRGSFPEDHFVLKVFPLKSNAESQINHRFSSTYMDFDLKLVDLTRDGIEEFVLITGQGRGTNVRAETLTVYLRQQSRLVPVLRIPFSAYYGINRWKSILSFPLDARTGSIHLALTLDYDSSTPSVLDDPALIPKDRYREYTWDSSTSRLVLYTRTPRGKELPNLPPAADAKRRRG